MYWFIAEDRYYYSNEGLERLKSQFKLQKIYVLPTIDEVKGNIAENEVGFIAPYSPSSIGDNSNLKALFVTKYLPNKYGVLTSHEKIACVSDAQAMEERLGLSVIDSGYSLANIAGAQLLKNFTNNLIKAEKNGYRAKAILLAGIPGTGKTFFVKCFAGELKRKLVQLNLSLIMESNEPIYKLNTVFEYFDKRAKDAKAQGLTESYVILIDEIEKMIGNGSPGEKRMLGRLLTVMNDANTAASEYEFDVIFCATANNLNSILNENPELLRRGRFDELFFLNLPTEENAKAMFEMYIKVFNLNTLLEISKIQIMSIMAIVSTEYNKDNSQPHLFPYSPAEIETFCKLLDFLRKAKSSDGNENVIFTNEDIKETVSAVIPIIQSAQEGTNKMAAQKSLFREV